MKTGASLKNRQGGAVAVMVGISMVVLIGFLAMVIDLGHLYVARAGLQNAADAAALSGAKQLNGTEDGIGSAVTWAKKLTAECTVDCAAQRNRFFGNLGWEEVALPDGNIHFSDDPYSSNWKTVAEAKVNPAGLYFIKVDTQSGAMGTWFAAIWNIFNISTYGSAVAGRFLTPIAPIGLCALDPDDTDDGKKWVQYDADSNHQYRVEYGYMRGVSYNFAEINSALSGLGPGTELYLHPTASSQAACEPSQGSADFAAPFLCTGKSVITGLKGSKVYTNTGLAAGKSIAALNTRFDQYGSPLDSSLDSSVCPPDTNIKEYTPAVASNWMSPPPQQNIAYQLGTWLGGVAASGVPPNVERDPRDAPASSVVSANVNAGGCGGDCTDKYGVLWSYTRPELSSGDSVPADWPALYPQGPTPVSSPAYAGTESTAYSYGLANSGVGETDYFREPMHDGSPNRRVLNVVLVQCPAASGGVCRPMTILGVGRFFLQRTASTSKWITGEFAGLVPQAELAPSIRLYR